jgi:hypothetical protein
MAIQKKSLTGNVGSTKKSAPAKSAATPSVPSASPNVAASMARPPALSKGVKFSKGVTVSKGTKASKGAGVLSTAIKF